MTCSSLAPQGSNALLPLLYSWVSISFFCHMHNFLQDLRSCTVIVQMSFWNFCTLYRDLYTCLKGQSHKIFCTRFFINQFILIPLEMSLDHFWIFFVFWLSYNRFKMTPQCLEHRGVGSKILQLGKFFKICFWILFCTVIAKIKQIFEWVLL